MELIDNRYQIEREIGRGAFGEVFLVRDCRADLLVCLKLLKVDRGANRADELGQEFWLLTHVSHPNLVKVLEFGSDPKLGPYYTMEYASGGALSEGEALPSDRFHKFFSQVGRALEHIHADNIIHGDLKPGNVLIDSEGEFLLSDFGISAVLASRGGQASVGSAAYSAPETLLGQGLTTKSDIYSFGILAFEMAVGHLPFGDDHDTILTDKLQGKIDVERIPEEYGGERLASLLRRMTAYEASERRGTMAEVLREYQAIADMGGAAVERFVLEGGFVGRQAELDWLEEHRRKWQAGENTVVLIGGESGVGKSALVEEFRVRAQMTGHRFFRVFCRENDLRPFSPVLKLLSQLMAELDPVFEIFESLGPDLKRLFPARYRSVQSRDLTEADIKASRRRLFDNLIRYLGVLCGKGNAILVIEDIHWADSDTLEFLKVALVGDMVSGTDAAIIVCTAQIGADDAVATILPESSERVLKLEAADESTWGAFLDRIFGQAKIPGGFTDELFQESGGNFLFVTQILRELFDAGLIRRIGDRWRPEEDWRQRLNIPQGMRSILNRRLERLPQRLGAMVEMAATLGRSFLPDEIGALGGADLARGKNFDELIGCGILNRIPIGDEERLDFAHGQLRKGAYERIAEDRRRELHSLIAEYLRERGATPEALGHHYLMAGVHDRAGEYLMESARNAEGVFAFERAAHFYRSAIFCLEKTPPSEKVSEEILGAYLGLGRALDFVSPVDATTPLEKAMDIGAGKPEAALALGNNLIHLGDNERAIGYLTRAAGDADRLGQKKLAGESRIGQGFAYDKLGRLDMAERSYLEALDLFAEIDYPEGSCRALNYMGIIRKRQGDINGALDFYRRALEISLQKGFLWLATSLYGNLGNLYTARGDQTAALQCYGKSLEMSRAISDRRIESINLLNIGHTSNELGRLDEGEKYLYEAAAKFKEIGDKGSGAITLNNLGLLFFRKGEMRRSLESYDGGLTLSLEIGQPRPELANRIGLAEVYLTIADYARAESEANRAREMALAINDIEQLEAILVILADLYIEKGDIVSARKVIEQYLSFVGQSASPYARCRMALLARLAEVKGFETDSVSADARCEPLQVRLEAAAALAGGNVRNPELWLARLDDAARKAISYYQYGEYWRLGGLKFSFLTHCGEKFELARQQEKLTREITRALAGFDNRLTNNLLSALRITPEEKKGAIGMSKVSREERLEVLIRVTRTINTIRELDPLLNKIMDLALETLGGERGFILLFSDGSDPGGRVLEPRVARNLAREDILSETTISHSSAIEVAQTGKPLLLARAGDGADARQSVLNFRISSVLCVPLAVKGDVLGIVYVDSRSGKTFTGEDLDFLTSFADLAAIAIENARLAEGLSKKNIYLQKQVESIWGFGNIVGRSATMQRVFRMAESVAQTDVTVVITGESGTGKELLARAIHFAGQRRAGNFVPVDCGALAETLLESELFGYVKGAFTGATNDREGLFEVAGGGTVFLDEIANTSKGFQAKLLRVLQESEIRRVGDNRIRRVDVRVIAASNRDLETEVRSGNFREDLFYRLNVVNISLPPLKERPEDIPILANYFLERICAKQKAPAKTFAPGALDALLAYDWPGNVRQLENICERMVIFAKGGIVEPGDLPAEIRPRQRQAMAEGGSAAPKTKVELKAEKSRLERLFLTNLLGQTRGNVMEASRISGMDRSQIHHLMSRFGLDSADFKKGD
jgi:Nif-specific regulatory protein